MLLGRVLLNILSMCVVILLETQTAIRGMSTDDTFIAADSPVSVYMGIMKETIRNEGLSVKAVTNPQERGPVWSYGPLFSSSNFHSRP